MNCTCLRLVLVISSCTLCAVAWPAAAWAGGGTTGTGGMATGTDTGMATDTDTDTGMATGTGTDTGMVTGTGTSTSGSDGSSSGEMCVECEPSLDPVQIVSPADGTMVTATFDVRVTAPYTCACAGPRPPFNINLRVDGTTVASCQSNDDDCNTEDQTFTIGGLSGGPHTLDAVAEHDGSPEFSASIEIISPEVAGEDSTGAPPPPPPPPPPSTTSGEGSSGDTGSAAADGGSGGGCGCRAQSHGSTGSVMGLLALLGLGALRRRR